jgi:cyclic di-GMP phosphodiesterase
MRKMIKQSAPRAKPSTGRLPVKVAGASADSLRDVDLPSSALRTVAEDTPAPRVLVVDDDDGVRTLLGTWVKADGYQCVSTSAAAEALEAVESAMPDVALVDVRLPDRSGLSLARTLRTRREDLAVIMITGISSFDAAVQAMRLGAIDCLLKPVSRLELLAAVARAVEWRNRTLALQDEHARLRAEVEERSRELSDVFRQLRLASAGALEALLTTLHLRQPEAVGHARRVAALARTIGVAMALSPRELDDLERGALMHDIGKIAMPETLLRKPGALNEDEMGIIRTHPEVGYRIVSGVPMLERAAEIVLASHERWDGRGYPAGLRGEAIPLGARIAAVADTFDALTSARVYRDPQSAEAAVTELVRCAGTQFDPAVVHAWLQVVQEDTPGEYDLD